MEKSAMTNLACARPPSGAAGLTTSEKDGRPTITVHLGGMTEPYHYIWAYVKKKVLHVVLNCRLIISKSHRRFSIASKAEENA
jgi:hypothetical protein